jgi:YgiT-type zinc finger domain-containing protein
MTVYNDCFYCGGVIKECNTSREIWWKGKLYIFENVPMGVCSQCGEKVLKPQVAKAIDANLTRQSLPSKFIQVPVYEYKPALPSYAVS